MSELYEFRVKKDCIDYGIDDIADYRGNVYKFKKLDENERRGWNVPLSEDLYIIFNVYAYVFHEDQLEKISKRGFKVVSDDFRKHTDVEIKLPKRATKYSAGYDFCNNTGKDVVIAPNEKVIFFTDIKVYMGEDEVLKLYIRSSLGIKKGLELCNGTGVIDSDFFENIDNDGNIGIALRNTSKETVTIKPYENVVQGIFVNYLVSDDDDSDIERKGGIGSTN